MSFKLRSWKVAAWRGFCKRCPACSVGRLFDGYLTVVTACPSCGEAMHHHQSDDAPPYFSIFAVGHIIVPGLLIVEKFWHPPLWLHFIIWLPLTLLLTLWMLPRVKGAVVGLQWAFGMHGFGGADAENSATKPEQFSPPP